MFVRVILVKNYFHSLHFAKETKGGRDESGNFQNIKIFNCANMSESEYSEVLEDYSSEEDVSGMEDDFGEADADELVAGQVETMDSPCSSPSPSENGNNDQPKVSSTNG